MKTVFHAADSRGHANHGWLDSHHSFSFANYYDPLRMHFGALRVLNDDVVDGGRGFGEHPHDNMEIISIPLAGDLEHRDSMGNQVVIKQNDVQIMSAGTGVRHSEFNHSKTEKVNFLQIWVFPKNRNIAPRYDQKTFHPEERRNSWQEVVSPIESGTGVGINQDAWFYLGNFESGYTTTYSVKRKMNGVYLFVVKGDVTVHEQALHTRDGMGLWETDQIIVKADSDAELLLMEVPMY